MNRNPRSAIRRTDRRLALNVPSTCCVPHVYGTCWGSFGKDDRNGHARRGPEVRWALGDARLFGIGAVGTSFLKAQPGSLGLENAPSTACRVARTGPAIASAVRTSLKVPWATDGPLGYLFASTGFSVSTPPSGTLPRVVGRLFQSDCFADHGMSGSAGLGCFTISEASLRALDLSVPPPTEQAVIERTDLPIQRRVRPLRRQTGRMRD